MHAILAGLMTEVSCFALNVVKPVLLVSGAQGLTNVLPVTRLASLET